MEEPTFSGHGGSNTEPNSNSNLGGRHSSVVLSAPTILWPRVRIPSTPSTLFSICIEIVLRKERKINKKEAGIGPF